MCDPPARSTLSLLNDFWAQFHRVWGLSSEQRYDKSTWHELQETTHQLLEKCGIERRREPRPPGTPLGS